MSTTGAHTPYRRPPRRTKKRALADFQTIKEAFSQAFVLFLPHKLWKNPVMFVVAVGTVLTILYTIQMAFETNHSQVELTYFIALDFWLFVTVLFANFATAFAEARGKAQAESLKKSRRELTAYRLKADGSSEAISSALLNRGDRIVVQAGQVIPSDGEIVEGIAYIDESPITGESAPVLREADSDHSGVTAGTLVLSDRIVILITSCKGNSFLDKMIALVEGTIRSRTPNEIALSLVLSAFTLVFLIVVVPLWPIAYNVELYMATYLGLKEPLKSLATDVPTLIALLVCLIPTTIGALLAAIGIAGMERALQANIIAKSGKAVELAGDIDVILLDKTGTVTTGNRNATAFLPLGDYSESEFGRLAALASVADKTPEGKSILKFYEEKHQTKLHIPPDSEFISFSAQIRMSGINLVNGQQIRKGAVDAICAFVVKNGGQIPCELNALIEPAASHGATPLVIADTNRIIGIVVLEDVLKSNISERFAQLRRMGLETIMITGDNPLAAAFIAKQAGIDQFLAEATPERKLAYIKQLQSEGKIVAMMGDGTNDAPALAQADVALAMNAGTEAAKEASNMVDLDSDPTKLIEVVAVGKQLLITRGALTTFSIANDVAKYFAIIPAIFAGTLPWLKTVDIMHLHSPTSAIMSAVIFNALIIPLLIPVAIKGITHRCVGADALLRRNLLIWGLGGIILPFIGIKLIDLFMIFVRVYP